MATEANKLRVGIFLVVGFLLFNGALIWIGASRLFEKSKECVTYFGESVQGVEVGSVVKYRGVPLGRVKGVHLAPDGRLVEVVMEIDPEFRVLPGLRASISTPGITGVGFVEIGFPPEGVAPQETLKLPFAPPGCYIPSQRSFLTNLTSALTEIATRLQAADLPSLLADYREVAVAARRRLDGPEIDRALERIAGAAASLEGITGKVSDLLGDPRVSRTLERIDTSSEDLAGAARSVRVLFGDPRLAESVEDVRTAAASLRAFAATIGAESAALRTGERLDAVQRRIEGTMDRVDATAEAAGTGVRDAGEAAVRATARWARLAADLDRSLRAVVSHLDRTAGRLESLARSLEANPSRLILEKPAKGDF